MTTRRVLRWSVPVDDQWHQIGAGTVVHTASRQRGVVEVWTLEESADAPIQPAQRTVRVYGTGHAIHDRDVEHIGTALDGALVWHVFGSTPRPRAQIPEWRPNDTLELVGWYGVEHVVTVIEKPTTVTTKIRTNDTGATMLVANTLLRPKVAS